MKTLSLFQFFISPMFTHSQFTSFSGFIGIGTGFTSAPTMVTCSILFCIFMAMNTMGLSGFYGHKTITSHHIISMSNHFKMIRIYAKFISTQMIKIISYWHFPFAKLITKTISFFNFISCPRNMEYSVSFAISTGCPYPTGLSFINFDPEVCHRSDNNVKVMECKPWR